MCDVSIGSIGKHCTFCIGSVELYFALIALTLQPAARIRTNIVIADFTKWLLGLKQTAPKSFQTRLLTQLGSVTQYDLTPKQRLEQLFQSILQGLKMLVTSLMTEIAHNMFFGL